MLRNLKAEDHFNIMGELIYNDDPLTELVVLGDSYTNGYLAGGGTSSIKIPEVLANLFNLNLHNYGVNAAGYTIPGNTFESQLVRAIADLTYNHNKVKYVIVIGGINDVNNNPSGNVKAAANALVTAACTAFVNAKVIIAPCWGAVSLPDTQEPIFRNICDINVIGNVLCLYDNLKALIGYMELMGGDSIHPTEEGYKTLALNIYQMINGAYLPRGKKLTLNALNDWDISNLHCYRSEDSVRLYGYATPANDVTLETSFICTTEYDATFAGGIFSECYAFKDGEVNYPCAIQFEPSVALVHAPVAGFVRMYNDHGHTVKAGSNVLINIEVPLLNL